MKTLPQPVSDAERAVHHYKGQLLVKVMRYILHVAMRQPYVYAGDVPEDIVEKEHRQGVASNGFNALKALELIDPLPMGQSVTDQEIFGGRKKNKNPDSNGRWVCVYRLRSQAMAVAWLARNGGVPGPAAVPEKFVEQELLTEPNEK